MKRIPVVSSALRSLGYDAQTCMLEVEFESTDVYRYLDVDPADVEALLAAESMGSHLNEHIKPRYHYVYVGPS